FGAEPAELRISGERAPERGGVGEHRFHVLSDDERHERPDRVRADVVAAADGERETVSLVAGVRAQDQVRGGVVRILVHRVRAVARERRGEAKVEDFVVCDTHVVAQAFKPASWPYRPFADLTRSNATAATMITPVTICCTQL